MQIIFITKNRVHIFMKKIYIVLLLLSIVARSNAQQYLGIRGGNFAGISGSCLNPSFSVDGRIKWDVNLGSGGVVFENRRAADVKVREHRKRRKPRQMAVAVEFRGWALSARRGPA